ncbi:uncharacterized protein [Porites lutea]|uniref:uncharacterized protein isoform X5 n=1 Tax=Porites lutea TaxID=51062 RepID=UPI003CC690F3
MREMLLQHLKLFVGIVQLITACSSLSMSEFYPYGVGNGDTELPANDDGSSGEIPISILFPYFDRNHDSLFVNTNGVVSFLVAVSQFTPDPFPLGDQRRLISPFWGDVDTRKGGTVSYRESTDTLLLQRATADIRRAFVIHQKFTATWIFIVTWDRVAFYGASGGMQSKAGFNAGDGIRFFQINGSRTNDILNLPSTSNVALPGQWIFRTDEASVEAGGCNTKGSLTISPRSGIMLGGTNLKMSGPCFKQNDNIVVQFDGNVNINATFGTEIQSSVTVPVLNKTGRVPIKLSVDGGNSFDYNGVYTSVPINRNIPDVQREDGDLWQEDSSVDISWDSGTIGGNDDQVSIDLARYKMGEDSVPELDSFHTVVDSQLNTGHSQFVVTQGEGDGNIEDRYVNLVRISRKDGTNNVSQAQWVWSELFAWRNAPWADERCKIWHQKEPNPGEFKDDPSMQPCPRSITQAMADRGRFMSDEECNPSNRDGCSRFHEGAVHCFKMVNPSAKGAGQQCCYNSFGNLMMGKPNAGSLDRVHPNAGLPVISHFFHDLVPYQDCCRLSDSCDKYYEKRPSDDGSKYQAPRPATGFGDPHMVTLDGTPFTFNGYGEYFILKVRGVNFTLQGRMEPLIDDDGTKTDATVYTAFAGKESGSDTVQIHLNGRGLVDVLVNGEMVDFDELSFLEFNGVSVLKYVNTSKYSAIFHSGISVTVEGQTELLGLVTLVPTMFKGNTSGLLGYWDDSQESEYLRPDGTFLETNSSLEEIHRNFGQLWVTTEDESLFTYQQGKNHGSYFHPDYTPIFPDSQELVFEDKSLEEEAKEVCGDSEQCMFDIYTTKKVTIGKASKETVEQFVAVINDTVKPACVPLDSELTNGIVLRNDTENGIDYKFTCNRGFVMNGSNHVTCKDGVYNGTTPNCLPKECSPFEYGNPTNGRVEGNGRVYRSTYRFICNHGYVLFGHDTITCIENGTWNGTSPRCLKECPVLPSSLSNGIVYGSGNVEGVVYRFSCHDGYALVGSEILYCRENGDWNASVPSCLRECPALPLSLSNGFVSGRGKVEGSQYHFSCKKGYSLVGAGTLYCTDQGIWNGSFPTCFIECPELPSFIPNGQVYGSGSIQGSLFRFSCLAGYSLVGQSKTLLCSADGKWNASVPRCLKDCPLLPSSIPNGVSNGTGSVEGCHHYFTCDEGFSLVGRNTLFCNDEGKWNGSVPTCVIECPKLPSAIEHGIVKGSGYIYGSLYKFSCLNGYSIVGEDILYCTEKGMWNGSVPKCLKECPSLPSSIAHGFVNGSGYLEGSQHHFTCGRGYSLIGDDTLVCRDTGAWSNPPPKCLIECPSLPPYIRHGFVNGTGSVEGSLYSFNCKQGYSLVGKKNLYCTAEGEWNASIPICLKECPELPLLIANGFINGSGAMHGSLYTFKCQDGYSLVGHELLYCTEEGKWNASVPVCLKECPSLPSSISQGFINGSGSVEGSLYSFSCEYGYSLMGEKNLYCTAEGRWNASIPICLKECPSLPSSIRQGFINGSGSVEGSLYSFNCKQGYSLVGEKNLYCTGEGKWNASIPICLKECPSLPSSISQGFINGSGSVEGSLYSFSCGYGYSLMGEKNLYCTAEGRWNASIPICLKDCPTLPLSLPNGMVSGTGSVEGSYYYFSCQKHYSLLGANTLFCNKKGTWNGSVPACFKDCPEINQTLEHGHMNGSGSTFGTTYSFYCDEGYKMDGQSTVFCDEQGQWNATVPVCSRVHVGKIAKKTAWYVVPFSAMSGLVFIIVATGVVILLLRRWRSTRKGEEPMEGEEVAMNEQAITPRKTKVRWECLPILKTSKEPPTVV